MSTLADVDDLVVTTIAWPRSAPGPPTFAVNKLDLHAAPERLDPRLDGGGLPYQRRNPMNVGP
jgi:hypothetical protein